MIRIQVFFWWLTVLSSIHFQEHTLLHYDLREAERQLVAYFWGCFLLLKARRFVFPREHSTQGLTERSHTSTVRAAVVVAKSESSLFSGT